MTEVVEKIREVISRHQDFLLVAHKDADADTLGSALAFAECLRRGGKRAEVACPEPVPRSLSYLPGYEEVNRSGAPLEAVVVAFDAGSPDRFGNLRERIEAAPLTIVFDHHTSNHGFGDLCLVSREAAATAVIVFGALRAWGSEISVAAATNLYAAIFTDTGGFRHENTSGDVLQLAADLAALGADPAWVALRSYKSRSQSTLKLQALAGSAARYELEGRLVWSEVTQEMLQRSGAQLEEAEGVIDILQSLDTMLCAILFKELGAERTQVSVRTRGEVEAHKLVAPLGGGGHRRAAGAEVAIPLAQVEERLLTEARRRVGESA